MLVMWVTDNSSVLLYQKPWYTETHSPTQIILHLEYVKAGLKEKQRAQKMKKKKLVEMKLETKEKTY